MRRTLLVAAAVVVLAALGGAAFFLGDAHALRGMSVQHASANQLAEAMKADRFFSSYRERTLIVRGTVASVSGSDVGLQTGSTYSLVCDLGYPAGRVKIGDAITIVAEGANAERQPSGVLLRGCITP